MGMKEMVSTNKEALHSWKMATSPKACIELASNQQMIPNTEHIQTECKVTIRPRAKTEWWMQTLWTFNWPRDWFNQWLLTRVNQETYLQIIWDMKDKLTLKNYQRLLWMLWITLKDCALKNSRRLDWMLCAIGRRKM